MHFRVALALVGLPALLTSRSLAQSAISAHADAQLINTYRWRAIPRASGLNAQFEAAARFGGRRTGVSFGGWSNLELGTHRGGSLTDLRPGHWGPSEYDLWGEAAHSFGAGDVAAGFIWYEYRGRAGELGTGELYGRFRGSGQNGRSIAPEVSLWYDVVHRKAGYLEAGATVPVLALPFRGLGALAYLGAIAAVSLGHPDRRAELAATNFDRPGFTAADLSAGFRFQGGQSLHGLLLNAAGHLQVSGDDATRRKWLAPPAAGRPVRFYLSLGAGFRWPTLRDR
jgi:hypothetical protein